MASKNKMDCPAGTGAAQITSTARRHTRPRNLLLNIAAVRAEADAMSCAAMAAGALLLLKAHFWTTGPLRDDDGWLARVTGCTPAQWKKLRVEIEPLFVVTQGEWLRSDWADELEGAHESIRKATEKSRKANAKRWGKHPTGIPPGTPQGLPDRSLIMKGATSATDCLKTSKAPKQKPPSHGGQVCFEDSPRDQRGERLDDETFEALLMAETALGLEGVA